MPPDAASAGTHGGEGGSFKEGSAYRKTFRQGATLVPRMLCLVERVKRGRIGPSSKG